MVYPRALITIATIALAVTSASTKALSADPDTPRLAFVRATPDSTVEEWVAPIEGSASKRGLIESAEGETVKPAAAVKEVPPHFAASASTHSLIESAENPQWGIDGAEPSENYGKAFEQTQEPAPAAATEEPIPLFAASTRGLIESSEEEAPRVGFVRTEAAERLAFVKALGAEAPQTPLTPATPTAAFVRNAGRRLKM